MRGCVVAVLLLAGAGRADDGAWERIGERDGIAIERRSTGSSMHELRLTTRCAVPPAAMMATLWRHDEYTQFLPYLEQLDVLRDDGDSKLIYERIRVPLAKDRDLTVRVTRTGSAGTGTYEITSEAAPDEGPPATRDYVRIRTSLARWRLAPTDDGGTAVTYTIRTDAGGRMPAWLAELIEKDAAVKVLRAMLDRARRRQ